jgi:hypothetical protein
MPRQGWLYLSVNHLCFYAYILGRETKLVIRWTDITELDKTNSLLFPDSIRVATREREVCIECCMHTYFSVCERIYYSIIEIVLDQNPVQFRSLLSQ